MWRVARSGLGPADGRRSVDAGGPGQLVNVVAQAGFHRALIRVQTVWTADEGQEHTGEYFTLSTYIFTTIFSGQFF